MAVFPSGPAAAPPAALPRRQRPPPPGRPSRRTARTSRARVPRRWASTVVLPPRRTRPTSPGSHAVPPERTMSRLRASSSSAGELASSGVTVRRAEPVVAWPPFSSTCRSRASAAGEISSRCCRTTFGSGGSGETGRSPLTPGAVPAVRASATALSGRSPPGDSQTRARSLSRPIASATLDSAARTIETRPSKPVGPATTSASRTPSSARVSWSRARRTDARVAARAASWAESCGAGVARSGRSRSSRDSRSSGHPRSCSARVREPWPLERVPDIPTTLPATGAPGAVRSCPARRWG